MEKIPYNTILDISKKVNIVDVISEYLPIEKKGKNYFAICPFHDDHNPSMSISPEKQIYTCFVCGASGNVFNFVKNYENISFVDAVSKVALKVGINLNVKKSNYKPSGDIVNKKYYDMYELVSKLYKNNIKTKYGVSAINYLKNRNITDDIINEFDIGLSLDDNSVTKLLEKKGFSKEDAIEVGLIADNNHTYDIFRNRIMFPLYSTDGKIVAFSGRIYNNSSDNKYVNSKESVIFKKGNTLYNYHRASDEAKKANSIIIVEGFMDVIRLHSIGIKNVVATMGTAITKEHSNLIRRLSKNVILCFDGDKAGEKATISAINELEKIDIVPKIIRLEEDLDPDDYIVKKGKDYFLKHLKYPISTLEFKLSIDKKNTNFNDYNEISKYLNEVAKELEKIDDKVVYELTVKNISKETGVDIQTINSLVSKVPKKQRIIIDKRVQKRKDKYIKAEENLLYYMLKDPNVIRIYEKNISYLTNKNLSLIANKILDFYDTNQYINMSDFLIFLQDDDKLINEVLRIDELDLPPTVSKDEIMDYVDVISEGLIKKEILDLKEKIKNETDVTKKVILLEKIAKLKQRSVNNGRN